jgi:hypothetical protein
MKRKFIFVVDDEVGYEMYFEDEGDGSAKFQRNAGYAACLSSNPQIIEIEAAASDLENPVHLGWKYINGVLIEPEQQ